MLFKRTVLLHLPKILQKLDKTKYQEVKRLAENRKTWRKMTHQHTNLLTEKMATDDDDEFPQKRPTYDKERNILINIKRIPTSSHTGVRNFLKWFGLYVPPCIQATIAIYDEQTVTV